MAEITFVSNKTRKEAYRYLYIIIFAVITWALQISLFNRLQFFDISPNFIFLSCIFFGLIFGPTLGSVYGIVSSFLSASILFDHSFYFSYPLIGFIAGLLVKNIFSDELLLYILLSFILTMPFELLNGWQYGIKNQVNIFEIYFRIWLYSSVLNLGTSPLYYLLMNYITKKFKLR